ncbi:hypothetical protein [uncultured Tateyamaria sp.]|nr:hypothetical protein [uncultured Tateyamaria sp.]
MLLDFDVCAEVAPVVAAHLLIWPQVMAASQIALFFGEGVITLSITSLGNDEQDPILGGPAP